MASLAQINIKFSADLRQFSSEMQSALRDINRIGQDLQSVGNTMSIGFTLPILAAGAASVKMASDYEESLNKVNVAFGNSNESVKSFAKTTLDTFGIAEGTALDMAALFGDMATSMGLPQAEAANLSTSLVGLAGDLASFKNIGIEQATTALNGVFTGETESLKLLGIVMTEANLAQFALTQGITKSIKEMSQAEKVQLRYAFVMDKTKNAQGDFARTSGGAANQTRVLKERFKEIGQQLGVIILPAFTKLITGVNAALKGFQQLSPGVKTTIVVVGGLVAVIGPLLTAVGTILTLVPSMVAGFAAVKAAFVSLTATIAANPFGALAVALSAVVASIVIYNASKTKLLTTQQALNNAVQEGNKNAETEISKLDTLFKKATSVVTPIEERRKAVEELQALYPAYFKNIDTENIKNQSSIEIYKQLRQAIFDKAKAAAIEVELQKRAAQRLQIEIGLREKIAATEAEIERLKKASASITIQEGSRQDKALSVSEDRTSLLLAQTKLLKIQKQELDDFTNASLKSDEVLLGSKILYDQQSSKLAENEKGRLNDIKDIAASSASDTKIQIAGTISFYETQIAELRKLQTEVATTATKYALIQNEIDKIQEKIDGIKVGTIQLPKLEPIDLTVTGTESLIQADTTIKRIVSSAEIAQLQIAEMNRSMSESFTQIAESAFENLAVGFGQAIAAMVQGANVGKTLGEFLLKSIGQLMVQLGRAAIQIGVTMSAIKASFKTPVAAIAAGIALTVLGSLIQSFVPDDFQRFQDGGIVGGNSFYGDKILARVNSGELILNQQQQKAVYGMMSGVTQNMNVGFQDILIEGDKLRIILDRTDAKNNRKK